MIHYTIKLYKPWIDLINIATDGLINQLAIAGINNLATYHSIQFSWFDKLCTFETLDILYAF